MLPGPWAFVHFSRSGVQIEWKFTEREEWASSDIVIEVLESYCLLLHSRVTLGERMRTGYLLQQRQVKPRQVGSWGMISKCVSQESLPGLEQKVWLFLSHIDKDVDDVVNATSLVASWEKVYETIRFHLD